MFKIKVLRAKSFVKKSKIILILLVLISVWGCLYYKNYRDRSTQQVVTKIITKCEMSPENVQTGFTLLAIQKKMSSVRDKMDNIAKIIENDIRTLPLNNDQKQVATIRLYMANYYLTFVESELSNIAIDIENSRQCNKVTDQRIKDYQSILDKIEYSSSSQQPL